MRNVKKIIAMQTANEHDTINSVALENATATLRAINHKVRQKIVKHIVDNDRIQVTHIYSKLRLSQSITSQHLAILREAKIVKTERVGRVIFYSLNNCKIPHVAKFVENITSPEMANNQ